MAARMTSATSLGLRYRLVAAHLRGAYGALHVGVSATKLNGRHPHSVHLLFGTQHVTERAQRRFRGRIGRLPRKRACVHRRIDQYDVTAGGAVPQIATFGARSSGGGKKVDLVESSATTGRGADPMTSTDRTLAQVPADIVSVERGSINSHFFHFSAPVRKRADGQAIAASVQVLYGGTCHRCPQRTSAGGARSGAWRRGIPLRCRGLPGGKSPLTCGG
jgi:hypothetical protein